MSQTCEEEAEVHVVMHPKISRHLSFSIVFSTLYS